MIKHLLQATALFALVSPALAEDSIGTPVTAQLIDGWQQADGTRISAIQLTLAPGWKTYWRAPGDAGIPPEFSWKGSRNLRGVSVSWPTPKVFEQNGMRSVGYSDQVMLPLAIAPKQAGAPVEIKLHMDIGVCKDICVPETLSLSGTLDAQGSIPVANIAAALAEQPYTASESGSKGVTCALSPSEDGLKITAKLALPSTGGPEHVVIEAGRPDIWVSEPVTSRSGNILTAEAEMVSGGTVGFAIDRSAIRFTVIGSSHAVDLRGCTPG
ncbi:protein-disulfide reductase DsbD domain-containing protein [Sulfitobacter sp.]|uniref:protein-disulfide reductase DsbD domain-containing protein n=1 Tax=Sulfitobacter sp. TaxID=1903071 RepID=UPI0030012569